MKHILIVFLIKINLLVCFFTFSNANQLDDWLEKYEQILNSDNKMIKFDISNYDNNNIPIRNFSNAKFFLGKNKKFRFEIEKRIVVSDGKLWKSYNSKTNQIFIQKKDKKVEKLIFLFEKISNFRSFIHEQDNEIYTVRIFKNQKKSIVYFNKLNNELDSIIIDINGGKLIVKNIFLESIDSLNFLVGNKNTSIIDLR